MKNAIFMLTAALLCLLMLTACAYAPGGAQTQQSIQATTQTTAQPAPETHVMNSVSPSEGKIDEFSVIYKYGTDPYEDNLIWSDCEVTNLYFIRLATDAETWVTDGERLYEIARMMPGEAIHYTVTVPEGAPFEAIVYTAGGKTYTYAISYNGRDGGIAFIPIDQLIVDPSKFAFGVTPDDIPDSQNTETSESAEILAEIYWVHVDAIEVFCMERTIESDSKWHVWKALKNQNPGLIPTDCSLLSCELAKGKDKVMDLNFSSQFNQIGSSGCEILILRAIANTYISTYSLNAVRFLVDGEFYSSSEFAAGTEVEYFG